MSLQLAMFPPPVEDWKPVKVSDLPRWCDAKRIGFDVETKDPKLRMKGMGPGMYRKDGHVAGYGFAIEDGPAFYLPVRHEGGDNLPVEQVLNYLRDNAKEFRGELVGAKLPYDIDWSKNDGIVFDNVSFFRDVQIADPLINELSDDMSLDAICERLKVPKKNDHLLVKASIEFGLAGKNLKDVKKNLHKLPGRYVTEYCAQDCRSPLAALRAQEVFIERENLWNVWNLESKIIPILLKMKRRGVRIDLDKLAYIEQWSLEQERLALAQVKHLTGIQVDVGMVWTKDALVPVFKQLGIHLNPMKVKANGDIEYQIDKILFEGHKDSEAVKCIAHARKVNKLRTTFAASVRRSLVEGRIHCTFNQIAMENEEGDQKGARYGRMSCINPNLQQQPSRDEFANMWRSIYIPEEGTEWMCGDYSQQEPRWVTEFAAAVYVQPGSDMAKALRFAGRLPMAAEAVKAYNDNPKLDNHDFMAILTGLKRSAAKIIYLGLCYGEGGAKLCHDLGLSTRWAVHFKGRGTQTFETMDDAMVAAHEYEGTARYYEVAGEEGQHIIDTFDTRAPYVKKLAEVCKYRAEARGTIRTAGGRLLHFPKKKDGTYDWTHKALNRLIQGTSADQMKAAMVLIDREMPEFFLQLQVHDELDGSITSRAQGARVCTLMRESMGTRKVPFRVDMEVGPSWGEIAVAA